MMANTQERAITPAEQKEFDQYATQGLKNLGFGEANAESDPDIVVQAISAFVEQWRLQEQKPLSRLFKHKPDAIDVALSLGILWGNQVARALGWQWTCLLQNGQEYFALVPIDRAYTLYPFYWMRQFLEDERKDNTIILLFNVLKAGRLPPSTPGTYYALS
jgi:hypothetical protein